MLTDQDKKALVEHRIRYYESKIFELQMDRAAALANGETIKDIDSNIAGLEKAIEAVKEMTP